MLLFYFPDTSDPRLVLIKALEELITSPVLKIQPKTGENVEKLKAAIEVAAEWPQDFNLIVESIKSASLDPKVTPVKPAHTKAMCMSFQGIIHAGDTLECLKKICHFFKLDFNDHELKIVHWMLLKTSLKIVLKESKGPIQLDQTPPPEPSLSDTELQVLRYVGGFLIRKTKRNVDAEIGNALLELIEDPTQTENAGNDFLQYTRCMIDAVDRGGLIHINDRLFIILVNIEKVAKKFMHLEDSSLKEKMTNALRDDLMIQTLWDQALTGDLSTDKRQNALQAFLDNFVTLRVKAYARCYNYVLSKKDSSSSRKSLRHHLT